MTDKEFILSQLNPFENRVYFFTNDQSVGDIKRGINAWFKKYKTEYDKIYMYFLGKDEYDTCRNIYNFLKKNVDNVTENIDWQTVKSPAAIIETGKTTGGDCKNYALFAGGILDAINRNGAADIPFAFRFAKYWDAWKGDYNNHVFIVAFPGEDEIWIDPINDVPGFDVKKWPDYYTDKVKKYDNMALVGLSGIGSMNAAQLCAGLADERDMMLRSGQMAVGDMMDQEYVNALADLQGSCPATVGDTISDLISTGANIALPGSGSIVTSVSNLLGLNKPNNDTNPTDYLNWNGNDDKNGQMHGTEAAWWTQATKQGHPSTAAEYAHQALNFIGYVTNVQGGRMDWLFPFMAPPFGNNYNGYNVTPDDVNQLLTAGGYASAGAALSGLLNNMMVNKLAGLPTNVTISAVTPASSTTPGAAAVTPVTTSSNTGLVVGGAVVVAIAIYFATRKKRA